MEDVQIALELEATPDAYSLEADGLLVHLASAPHRDAASVAQTVIPAALRALILRLCHDDPLAGHGGVGLTQARVQQRFYWPNMAKDIRNFVVSCVTCARINAPTSRATPVQMQPIPAAPFQRMHIDLVGPGITSNQGNEYVAVAIDESTRWVYLSALKNKSAKDTAEMLFHIFLDQGAIPEWIMDQGREWINEVIQHLFELLHQRRIYTSTYHPQSNGRAEELNRQVLKAIRCWCEMRNADWDQDLEVLQFKLRTTPNPATGVTPFFALYGREARMPYDLEFCAGDARALDLHPDIQHRLDLLTLAQQATYAQEDVRRAAIDRKNSKLKRVIKYNPEDLVMGEMIPDREKDQKLEPRYCGPWRVLRDVNEQGVTFLCRMQGRDIKFRTYHASRLKPYHMRAAELCPAGQGSQVTTEELRKLPISEQLDQVLDRCWEDNAWRYKLKLRDNSVTNWLPESEALRYVSSPALDTFHMMYELTRSRIPRHAMRRIRQLKNQKITKAQAKELFPLETPIARVDWLTPTEPEYTLGTIAGYLAPWWRARFDDGETCEWSKTQVLSAVRLRKLIEARGLATMSKEANTAAAGPKSFSPVPVYEQFRKNCIGRRLELMFNVGWCAGEIRALLGPNRYKVLFDGESNIRECRLPLSSYAADQDSPISSWRLYAAASTEQPAAGSPDLAPEDGAYRGEQQPAPRSAKRAKVQGS